MVQPPRRSEGERAATWRWRRQGMAAVAATALVLLTACGPDDTEGAVDEAAVVESAASPEASEGSYVDASTAGSNAESDSKTKARKPAKETKAKPKRQKATSTAKPKGDTRLYRVIRVVDGDTVKVDINGGESVRVIGINTPETVHPDKPAECGGADATAAARALLDGKRVAVVYDPTQDRRDRYGRLLAYLDIPQSGDFGETMLRKGHAKEYTYADPYQRRTTYRSAEQQARAADRGLWGGCTTSQQQEPKQQKAPEPTPAPSSPAPAPTTQAPAPKAPKAPAPSAPAPSPKAVAPGPGWTNDALTPGYTGCRQGYPGGKINGVYWWKPISC